ncbi:ferredoxin, partial [Streptomyces hainanensis]
MRVTVDTDRCCGSGQCVLLAPEVFDQREEDGIVALLAPRPAPAHEAAVREAAVVCPAGAITVGETTPERGHDQRKDGGRRRDGGQRK